MKRATLLRALLLLTLAVLGVAAGRWCRLSPSTARAPAPTAASAHPPSRTTTDRATTGDTVHDLAALRRYASGTRPQKLDPQALQLAHLSSQQLRDLLIQISPFLEDLSDDSINLPALREIIIYVTEELYRRDGAEAFKWAASLTPPDTRLWILHCFIRAATMDQPSLALAWIEDLQSEPGFEGLGDHRVSLLTEAIRQGNTDLLRRIIAIPGIDKRYFPSAIFPPDYDFPALFRTLGGKLDLSGPLAVWAMRDPQAAWAAVKDAPAPPDSSEMPGGNLFATVFRASLMRDGTGPSVAMAVENLSALPPDRRAVLLGDLAGGYQGSVIDSAALISLATALPLEDRQAILTAFRKKILYAGAGENSLALLATLPRQHLLSELTETYRANRSQLEDSPQDSIPTSAYGNLYNNARMYFTKATARFHLTPEELAAIHAAE